MAENYGFVFNGHTPRKVFGRYRRGRAAPAQTFPVGIRILSGRQNPYIWRAREAASPVADTIFHDQ